MRYVAAYLLARLAGKPNPTENDVKEILAGSNIEVDEPRLNKFFADLKASGKTVEELIAEGSSRMSTLGGSAPAAAAPAGGAAAAGDAPAAAAAPEPESESEEEEMDGFDLF